MYHQCSGLHNGHDIHPDVFWQPAFTYESIDSLAVNSQLLHSLRAGDFDFCGISYKEKKEQPHS